MELRQLEHFVAVAEDHHFTRAARRLHIVQSGLSASIRALERELGTELFIRSTRRVELTEAGRALLVEARRVLDAAASARAAVASVQGLLRGRLRLGILQSLDTLRLPEVLADFHAAHPAVAIQMIQVPSATLADRIREGQFDLVFASLPSRPEGLEVTPLVDVPIELVCGMDHRFADRRGVRLAELADETFIGFPPEWGGRMTIDAAFAAAGLERRLMFEVGDGPLLLDLVAEGLGVALVPTSLARRPKGVRYVPLRGERPIFKITAVSSAQGGSNPAARVLLDMVLARIGGTGSHARGPGRPHRLPQLPAAGE
ncbi:LysR family transcriptional regulator [Actinomadura sp. HBU206391]|nr:LysR family transcriptional regulator [Actinomadura sp. HBU206391]